MRQFDEEPIPLFGRWNRFQCNTKTTENLIDDYHRFVSRFRKIPRFYTNSTDEFKISSTVKHGRKVVHKLFRWISPTQRTMAEKSLWIPGPIKRNRKETNVPKPFMKICKHPVEMGYLVPIQIGLDPVGSFNMAANDELVQGCVGVVQYFILKFETPFVELVADGIGQKSMALLATLEIFLLEIATARPRHRVHDLNSNHNNIRNGWIENKKKRPQLVVILIYSATLHYRKFIWECIRTDSSKLNINKKKGSDLNVYGNIGADSTSWKWVFL